MSILKPLKGTDPSLYENLKSFFELETGAPLELLFSIENKNDPAYPIIKSLIDEFPNQITRVFFSDETQIFFNGTNPKIRNIAQSYEEAKHDIVLISDSNVRVCRENIQELLGQLDERTGIVTSIVAGTEFKSMGGFLEAVFLNTFYARFMTLSSRFAKPCVIGKSMLFQKSTAARFGGLKALAPFLAEDYMAGESMQKLGLKVKTAILPVAQIIGKQTCTHFWKRHLRWGRLRKAHAPLAFYAEPLSHSLFLTTLGSFAVRNSLFFCFASIATWMTADFIQFKKLSNCKNQTLLFFPFFWILRELLAIPLWIQTASSNEVDWRGNRLRLAQGGLLVDDGK